MDRSRSRNEKSGNSQRIKSEHQSRGDEAGVRSSSRSPRTSQLHSQPSFSATPKATEGGKAGRKRGTTRRPTNSTPHQRTARGTVGEPQRDFPMANRASADVANTDDPFEEFDVESGSEKEFLIANLRNDAPKDEIERFRGAQELLQANHSTSIQKWDTNMNQKGLEGTMRIAWGESGQDPLPRQEKSAPPIVLQKKVKEFARSHMFNVNKHVKPTTLQRRHFTRDIYDYARAIGMGKHQASAEVLLARSAYRRDRGSSLGFRLDESDDESTLGLEINDAAKYVDSIKTEMQRGPVDPAGAWSEVGRLQAKISPSDFRVKKWKRDILVSRGVEGGVAAIGRPDGNKDNTESKNSERKRLKLEKRHGNSEIQGPAGLDSILNRSRRRKEVRKRKLAARKANEKVKPQDQLPGQPTSQFVPTNHTGAGNIDGGSTEAKQEEPLPNGHVKHTAEEKTEILKVQSSPAHDPVRSDDAGAGPWDLRQKKKKKRKRTTVNGSTNNTRVVSANIETEAEDGNKVTNLLKDPLNIHLDQEVRKTVPKTEKKIPGDIVNDTENSRAARSRKKKKESRRNSRGVDNYLNGSGKSPPLVGNQAPASGDQFLDIYKRKRKFSVGDAVGDVSNTSGRPEERSEICPTISPNPETKCEEDIQTSSTTWLPHVMAQSDGKAESIDFDSMSVPESNVSRSTRDFTFTMSERSLDWDHSGPEFDEIKVEPKVMRSSPLKPPVTTPTKGMNTRSSSNSFQTPNSDRKSRDISDQSTPTPTERVQQSYESVLAIKKPTKAPVKSPFFSPPASVEKLKVSTEKKPRQKGGLVSCIPFPPLRSPSFGLLQEKLSQDPFRLLVGVTFLNRTMGKHAIPVFFSLMERYPTPADILAADKEDIISMTRHLGLQAQRAETYKKFANFWIHDPPAKGKRYRVDHYPSPGDGMDVKVGDIVADDDPRIAWEIGHMTKGRYAIDSWRIFCRDVLRGEAQGWNGEGREDGFQPEWMRVQPRDKELIACLRWMWLKEGFSWDPVSGEKEVADRVLMEAAIAGKITWDDRGGIRIAEEDEDVDELKAKSEAEAGFD